MPKKRQCYIAKYTINDIADAIKRSNRTVRRAINDNKFNPDDVLSLVDYIIMRQASNK